MLQSLQLTTPKKGKEDIQSCLKYKRKEKKRLLAM